MSGPDGGVHGTEYTAPISNPLKDITRAAEWWEFKLIPIVSVAYATAVVIGHPLHTVWPALLLLMASMVPGAAYVGAINDVTDQHDDRAAGKPVRVIAPVRLGLIVGACVTAGLVVGWLWRDDGVLLGTYAASWIAFSLYSLPPFRFKSRGALGVMCDALGALGFPCVVATLLVFRAGAAPVDRVWLGAVAVWAFAYGLRGILWHQLSDHEADRRAAVRTFVQIHGTLRSLQIANWVVFPIEIAALAALLWHLPLATSSLALAAYGVFAVLMIRTGMVPVIAGSAPRYVIVLREFYTVFLPMAVLATAIVRSTADAWVLVVHCIVFPGLVATLAARARVPVRSVGVRLRRLIARP